MKQRTRVSAAVGALCVTGLFVSQLFNLSPNFGDYEAGPERKQAFFDYFVPIIAKENMRILEQRQSIEAAIDSSVKLSLWPEFQLHQLASEYKFKDFDANNKLHLNTLLHRIDMIPPSMALAQGANESAWGTSRFAEQGNNFFGQWCYKAGCGIVPKNRNSGATHEVARFGSPAESVRAYMNNLNTHKQYKTLRDIRAKERKNKEKIQGVKLIEGLIAYSERGAEYVSDLRIMIKQNKLEQYDP